MVNKIIKINNRITRISRKTNKNNLNINKIKNRIIN